MAARIIGLLQVVDVEQQHGSGITAFLRFQNKLFKTVAVRQVGQGIRLGSRAKNVVQSIPALATLL